MKADKALELMQARLGSLVSKFEGTGIDVKIESDLLDKKMDEVQTLSKASIITVSMVLSCEGCDEEYCLSAGAEVSRGFVNDTLLKDLDEFSTLVDETVERLKRYESRAEGIRALVKEADGEIERLADDMKSRRRKKVLTAVIALLAIGAVCCFVVAITLGLGG